MQHQTHVLASHTLHQLITRQSHAPGSAEVGSGVLAPLSYLVLDLTDSRREMRVLLEEMHSVTQGGLSGGIGSLQCR